MIPLTVTTGLTPIMRSLQKLLKSVSVAMLAMSVTGCALMSAEEPAWKAAVAGDGTGDPALIDTTPWVVSNLPKSRSGNRAEYTVFDVSYSVLDSAENFRERGVASWYGKKFHGNPTASGEIYDMHLMTAAHRQLPVPTFVRVTRLDNDRTVVVKVNDRGPFVDDRIIDLSYAAAAELGMLETGTADVYIEAISSHENDSQISDRRLPREVTDSAAMGSRFVQAGAFAERGNAEQMISQLQRNNPLPVLLDFDDERALYRVRVGPLKETRQLEDTMTILAAQGIKGYIVASEVR